MKSGRPIIFVLVAILIGVTVLSGGVIFSRLQDWGKPGKKDRAYRPIPVEVAQIRQGPIALQRTFSGELEAQLSLWLHPK